MKAASYSILCSALTFLLPFPSFAQLGKTADECTQDFGRPAAAALTFDVTPPARIQYQYIWRGIYIRADFVGRDVTDSRCGLATYHKHRTANEPIQVMTEAEIASLLAVNASGAMWEVVPGGWKRSDNRALAVETKYIHNGVPDNGLTIFTSDFYPKGSKSFAEVRASISFQTNK
jgi:hypothetical protein